jgi:hypothetical protein
MENEERDIRLADVQEQFTLYCYRALETVNTKDEWLDPKVFDTIAKFMEKTGIKDSEGPGLSPELLEAAAQARKVKNKRAQRDDTEG